MLQRMLSQRHGIILTFWAIMGLLVGATPGTAQTVPTNAAEAAAAAQAAGVDAIPSNLPAGVREQVQQAIEARQGTDAGEQAGQTTEQTEQTAEQEQQTEATDEQTEEDQEGEAEEEEETPVDEAGAAARVGLPYGHGLFHRVSASFAPIDYGPVDPGYRIGPGDELVIQTWGEVELSYRPKVGRDGTITLPIAGRISVSSLTVDEAENRLMRQLARHHQSLRPGTTGPRSYLSVSLGRLRPITIFVLGEVKRPGAYTVGAATTAFQALYAAGGPSMRGSLRNICTYHANARTDTLDAYDYIMRGDREHDVRLKHMEVVFVPVSRRMVQVRGAVRRRGIYELRENEQLPTLLEFAAGIDTRAAPQFSQIQRIVGTQYRLMDVNLVDSTAIDLHDGDILSVGSILDDVALTVAAEGQVVRPHMYNWVEGMTVSSLLQLAEGLKVDAYLPRADIVRRREDGTTELITCSLDSILAGHEAADLPLMPYDRLIVRSIYDFMTQYHVSIEGEVRRPGRFLFRENLHVSDLLFQAGGLSDDAYLPRANLVRRTEDGETRVVPVNLERVLAGHQEDDIALTPRDRLIVRSIYAFRTGRNVSIYGEVRQTGEVVYREGMQLSDLLFQAGGITPSAYTREVQIHRRYLRGDQSWTDTLTIPLSAELDSTNHMNWPVVSLQPGDNVVVRQRPDWNTPSVVNIRGQVMIPGPYILRKRRESVVEVLRRAGGLTTTAYIQEAYLERPGVGRVALDLEEALEDPESHNNLGMLPGDMLMIPSRPQTVSIAGAVGFPTNAVYVPGEDVEYYLDLAGGLLDSADVSRAYIVHHSGRVQKAKFCKFFWRDVPPGARIVVPARTPRPPTAWGDTVRDIMTFTGAAATTILLIFQVTKEL